MTHSRCIFVACIAVTLSLGCGKSGETTDPGHTADPCDVLGFSGSANPGFSTAGVFTASPMALSAISFVTPLGNLNPPIHVYPTDHIYLIPVSSVAGANPIAAAAAGTVINMYQPSGTDWKIMIKVDRSFYYYYDHVTPASGVSTGSAVTAGQIIGTNSGNASAVDFGLYNFNNPPLAGILNACVLRGVAQVDAPLKYFAGALQSSLYAKVSVSGAATKDGRIDYDESGKLVGNWVITGKNPQSSPADDLAFTYNVSSHALRVSAGSSLSGGGSWAVQTGAPDFATITQASGQVNYRLYPTIGGDSSPPGTEFGVLAVQVISATRIKVEVFPGNLTG